MHSRIRLFAALTLLVALLAVPCALIGVAPIRGAKPVEKPGIPVDVELVIAVDISYSMDPEEQALQREGYIQALTSREFLQALRRASTARSPSPISNGPATPSGAWSCRGG